MAYAKINSVTNANMAKVSNVAKAAIGKIDNIDAPADGFSNTYSLDFDGSDDRLVIGDVTILDDSNTFTISTWVKFDSLPSEAGAKLLIVSKDEAYELYIKNTTPASYLFAYLRLNNGPVIATLELALETDTWYHIAAVHDENGTAIYLDGDEAATELGSQVESIDDTAASLGIGARAAGSYPMDGHIDEVAIFDAALSAEDITIIYNSGTPTDLSENSKLVGYWRMGDGAAYPTIPDGSSSGNDGTMTNMTSGDIVEDVPSGG